jgi:RNA polymerase sigma-70 factor (ECF subfamily)
MDGISLELASKNPAETSRGANEVDERALIRSAQRGDREAFEKLVRLYDQEVLRMALKLVRSPEEAQDLYQEAFLKVYRSIGKFRLESRFSTWLYRVVMNVFYDHLRRQKSRAEVPVETGGDGEAERPSQLTEERPELNPHQALHAREIGRRLEAALGGLTARERIVFEMKHCQGLKLRVIGELCGTSEEAAKNSLFRAMQKLRVQLADLV